MKKFLIFLVSIVVIVSLGLTTYYFMRNDEVISVNTKEIYCNAGDSISLDELNITVKKKNKNTKYYYNAGGEDVTKFVNFEERLNAYTVSESAYGDVELVVSTSNRRFTDMTVTVHIGNGTVSYPYFVFTEEELDEIGTKYPTNKAYILMSDIELSKNFMPIENFNGSFDGNYHTIKGQNIIDQTLTNAGFFTTIMSTGSVKNLTIDGSTISGSYQNAGILAGSIYGTVYNCKVSNSTITNSFMNSNTGAFVGINESKTLYASCVEDSNIIITADSIYNKVGGFAGVINKVLVQACYAKNVNIQLEKKSSSVGGFVGLFEVATAEGSIQQSYCSVTSNFEIPAFVGTINSSSVDVANASMHRHLVGNVAVSSAFNSINDKSLVGVYDSNYFVNAKNTSGSVFYDNGDARIYAIKGYKKVDDIHDNNFIFFANSSTDVTYWDMRTVWDSSTVLPKFVKSPLRPTNPDSEYYRKLSSETKEQEEDKKVVVKDEEGFKDIFSKDQNGITYEVKETTINLGKNWYPKNIKNCTIYGNGATIYVYLYKSNASNSGIFAKVDHCTIKNLNIVVLGVDVDADNVGALAGVITSYKSESSSSIQNIKTTYNCTFANCEITNFGGLAGSVDNTAIKNSSVTGLNSKNLVSAYSAGFVSQFVNATMTGCSVNATLYGANVGGAVSYNKGTISKLTATIKIIADSTGYVTVGGIATTNNCAILDSSATVNILVNSASTFYVGGISDVSTGKIIGCSVQGDGISFGISAKSGFVGGVTCSNSGEICETNVKMSSIGKYSVGEYIHVGGLTHSNGGTISKCVMTSDLYGTYVGGIAVKMNISTNATVDQVYIGKLSGYKANSSVGQNILKSEKYGAGLIVDFRLGKVSNVQAKSNIIGGTNKTRSSLVVLVFPNGASLINATIDSSLTGYGYKYAETWTDFSTSDDKTLFPLSSVTSNGTEVDRRFNLYVENTQHGIMQSVVINDKNAGVEDSEHACGEAWFVIEDYENDESSSFVKLTSKFYDASEFQGSFKFVICKSSWFGIRHYATKTLTFEVGSIWKSSNGIYLSFVENIK